MKDSLPKINLDIKTKFKAILCQPNVMLVILCLCCLLVIVFLGTVIISIHSFFALFFIALIILVLVGLGIVIVFKSDTTESIEYHYGDNKLIIKSPSRQLMPTIMKKLLENTARPNRLIPIDIDPKEDPSKFQPLTEEQQEAIVKKEVEVALLGKSPKE